MIDTNSEVRIHSSLTRRRLLSLLPAAAASLFLSRRAAWALSVVPPHPTPRPGITGAKVLTKAQLSGSPKLIPLFDSIRKIPHVVDGIRCNCGCTNPPEFYSLLSCYEGKGMARDCFICQGQGRLAVRLHREGKSLDEIRTAVDAKFG
ncbi:MAG TPA: hypothetical protein VHM24_00225 [Gemmatimonadaceae bacterium]|nr:hypothetical protein [Gemmatimonadaceae bacterium]